MRTTLTIDEDVAYKLHERSRQTGDSFRKVVNDTLRQGLAFRDERQPETPFRVEARPLGLRPGLSYDNIGELLDRLDDE